MIAACPLAFGEVSVKERIRSVMNYKKPTFWIIVTALVVCVVVAVCFLTNPKDIKTPMHIIDTLSTEDVHWSQITIWEDESTHICLRMNKSRILWEFSKIWMTVISCVQEALNAMYR